MIEPMASGATPSDLTAMQQQACAHLRVSYRTRAENGVTDGWWECDLACGARFWPSAYYRTLAGLIGNVLGEIRNRTLLWRRDEADKTRLLREIHTIAGDALLDLLEEPAETEPKATPHHHDTSATP